MKTSKTLKLLVGAAALMVAVGALWWVVGYTLGRTILSETGGGAAFRAAFGFRDAEVSALLFLAFLVLVVRLVAGEGAGRWLRLAGVAGVAAIVGGAGPQGGLTIALFVFAAAAVAEAHAMEALVVALAAGAVVALASVLGTGLETGQKLLALALRDLFFYAPLLFGPELLDSLLWKE
jgi:sterol desaturase/sphingolipid hydroxylase (fatty acid hydroxylase superfamily)